MSLVKPSASRHREGQHRQPRLDRRSSGRATASLRELLLCFCLACLALLLFFVAIAHLHEPFEGHHLPWPLLALLFALAESFPIEVELRNDAHTVLLEEVPLVLGLLFVSPSQLLAAALVGVLASLAARRQRPLKIALNTSESALEVCLALIVFHALARDPNPASAAGWVAAFAATLVVAWSGALISFAVTSVPGEQAAAARLGLMLLAGTAQVALNTTLALVAAMVASQSFTALWTVFILVVAAYVGSRSYSALRSRYTNLSSLYRFTNAVSGSLGASPVTPVVLDYARQMLRAERCELTLFGPGGRGRRTVLGGDGKLSDQVVALAPGGLERQVASSGRPLLATPATRDARLARILEAARARDAVVAPLRGEEGPAGTLMVANRLGDSRSFTAEDLTLLETLANHAAIALQNDRLAAQLRQEAAEREHRALHDPLTGLPNRALFSDRIEQAIESAGARTVAVLLVDLDRFKEVNDTLGHQSGDALLREAGSRLLRALGGRGTLARLAGDEFGVLLAEVESPEAAIEIAEELKQSIGAPFVFEELTFEIGASAGVALHPAHGSDPAMLLQRADVAKYAAKRSPGGTQLYSPEHDHYTPRRLALAGELRAAIESGDLAVYFQPIVAMDSAEAVAVEALVRWPHQRHGILHPEEFVPIAEQTGLIRPLTEFVIDTSLEHCSGWSRRGLLLRVAVNMSVRLVDTFLPDKIERALRATNVPAQLLTLELTESSIMADLDNTLACLGAITSMGVSVSVDDFGTGYSSLSYLRRLPVDELKIDKSFILHMSTDANDAVIVRSTINLARNLGLRVVAEGVEDRATWGRLRGLGCDLAQGYLVARPMSARRFEDWLREWPSHIRRTSRPRRSYQSPGSSLRR